MYNSIQGSPGSLRRWGFVAIVLAFALLAGSRNLHFVGATVGPAPPSQERRIIAGVHADAIAVVYEENALRLATRADVDGNTGVRFDPDTVAFNVEDAALFTIPADPAYSFLGTEGSQIWMAPMNNPGGSMLWPGISTDDVHPGVLNSNQVTLTLVNLQGPGAFELFQVDGSLNIERLLSSTNGAYQSWTVETGQHLHANWVFSTGGTYTLTITATAMVGDTPVSDTQDYVFIVSEVPGAVATTTSLSVSPASSVQGSPVTLTSTVTPANAIGYVEFLNGTTVVGHEAVSAGTAMLSTTSLPIGTHSLTARFVPEWTNNFSPSTSTATNIAVTDTSGVPFSITGIQASYNIGDTLNATVVGGTLEQGSTQYGQRYRWLRRAVGSTDTGGQIQAPSTGTTLTQSIDASSHGYEISVTIRQCSNTNCTSGSVIAQTPWVAINVEQDGERPEIERTLGEGPLLPGETIRLEASGLNLAEGESFQFVVRSSTGLWSTTGSGILNYISFSYPEPHILEGVKITRATSGARDYAVQVIRDGIAVRQSEPLTVVASNLEIMIDGVQGLYMEGTSADLSAIVYPARAGNDLNYQWQFSKNSGFGGATVWAESSSLPLAVQKELNVAEHNEGYLRVRVTRPGWTDSLWADSVVYDGPATRIYVTDDPNAQLFFLSNLSPHYHQGDNVNFSLTVFPEPEPEDQIIWEWQWPGMDWEPFPGASGKQYVIKAEQGLHGVQVRATLDFASDRESIIAPPVTIGVDDHGAAARQKPTISGEASVMEGDTVILTRELPSNGATILTTHRWQQKPAGSEDWQTVPGQTGPTLAFTSTLADDGTAYRVSIMKPTGEVAYGPSPEVVLTVSESDDQPGETDDGSVAVTVDVNGNECFVALGVAAGSTVFGSGALVDTTRIYAATLPGVTVTASCTADWTVSGQSTDFTSGSDSFGSNLLGWTPSVVTDNLTPGEAIAGAAVAPGNAPTDGLKTGRLLGKSQGGGAGSASFNAELELQLPVMTPAGSYSAVLTLSVFPN